MLGNHTSRRPNASTARQTSSIGTLISLQVVIRYDTSISDAAAPLKYPSHLHTDRRTPTHREHARRVARALLWNSLPASVRQTTAAHDAISLRRSPCTVSEQSSQIA